MDEAIYWARLTDLSAAVKIFSAADDTLMMLERALLTWLDESVKAAGPRFARFDPQEPFNQWERGRIFNPAGELRWEKMDGYFYTVYAGNDTAKLPAEFKQELTLTLNEPVIRHYFLWGKRQESKAAQLLGRKKEGYLFAEFGVGGILVEYPAAGQRGGRVRLEVAEYIDPATQERLYYRFRGVA